MKNTDIKYNLSDDYNKLHDLLKKDNIIIGFTLFYSKKRLDKADSVSVYVHNGVKISKK